MVLGDRAFEDVRFRVAALPVFDSLRGGGQCNALLGVAFFARFERVEIDFRAGVVRLGPERG